VWYKSPFGNRWTTPMPETEPFTFIATTAGEATAELARSGLAPDQRIMITIESPVVNVTHEPRSQIQPPLHRRRLHRNLPIHEPQF
jgi:hypothetical protein